MSQWSVFGVDITPKFTDDIKNVLKVTCKKEIFFDVFECMYNGKTIIVEKVGTSDGLPVVSFEAVKNNKKYKCEALLVESEESELFLNENHLQFLKSIQKTPIKTIIEEKVEKVIPANTVYEDKVRDVSEKIIKESQEKAQKLYDNKLKEYKNHKKLIAKQAEEYLNEKSESIRQELYEQYIDFLSGNDKKVNNLIKSNIDGITLSIDENNKEILSKVDKLSNLNKEELTKILSENIVSINNSLDNKIKDLNDQLDIILHDSNTKIGKLQEKTNNLIQSKTKSIEEKINSRVKKINEKVEDYKVDTLTAVVEKISENKSDIETYLKGTISEINEQVDIKNTDVKKILADELSNINEKLNIFSEEEDKKYKQLLENLNNLNKGEVKEILSEKINDKQLNSLKLDISKQFQNEMMSIKRLIEMSSGGGSVAKQFANGGTMDGSLNVTQNILSGGTNLLDIFNTDTSIDLQDVTDNGNTTTNSISSSGTIFGDIGQFTTLNALTANFTQTIVSTTSALSVVNDGTGPALYVQQSGNEPIATFIDKEGGTVIIDDGGNVGIGTSTPSAKLHSNGTNNTDYLALFTSNGSTPDLSQSDTVKRRAIAVQGEGAAYYVGRDLTNNIEFVMGTSTAGVAFLGSLTNHGVDIRVNNQNALKINTAKDVTVVDGHLNVDSDSKYLKLGASQDAGITYNGTNMVFDSQLVGAGDFVFENGNVGIGVNPTYRLDINDSSTTALNVESNSYTTARFKRTGVGGGVISFLNATDDEWSFGTQVGGEFAFHDRNNNLQPVKFEAGAPADSIYLDSTGNVGIGTDTPSAKLHIAGAAQNSYIEPRVENTAAAGAAGFAFINSNQEWKMGVNIYDTFRIRDHGASTNPFVIEAGGAPDDSFHMDSNGNVGIGTDNPNEALTVSGNISASGSITSNGITSNGDLDMNGNSIVNVASGSITFEDGASIGSSGTGNLSLSGNVGIGTDSPDAKLEVFSTGTQLRLTNTDTVDYTDIYTDSGGDLNIVPSGRDVIHSASASSRYRMRDTSANIPFASLPGNDSATYASFGEGFGGFGNLVLQGYSDGNREGFIMQGHVGTTTPTKAGTSIQSWKSDGVGGRTAMTGSELIFSAEPGQSGEVFVIQANGNVGIGTSTPSAKLDVSGVGKMKDGIFGNTDVAISADGGILYNGSFLSIDVDEDYDPNGDGTGREGFMTFKKKTSNSKFSLINGTNVANVFIPTIIGQNLDDKRMAYLFRGFKIDSPRSGSKYSPAMSFEGLNDSGNALNNSAIASFANVNQMKVLIYGDGRIWSSNNLDTSSNGIEDMGAYQLRLDTRNSSTVGARINLSPTHTADAFQIFDSNNNGLFVVDSTGNVGIGTDTPSAKLEVVGHFTATTKSFLVDKPNGGKLQYGVTESNEHSVFVRGKTDQETIKLPEEWEWLVDEDSVTVTITPVGKFQPLYVISQSNNEVKVGGVEGEYNYVVYGTRKDVAPLEVNV